MKCYKRSFFKWMIISLMCLYLGFMVGKFKQDILQNSIELLQLDTTNLTAENAAIMKKLSSIQGDYIAEKQANEALVIENRELNDALGASKNKLYFYERVVAPELAVTGLNIYSFKMTKGPDKGHWFYELVLMQAQKGRRIMKGKVDIIFDSADDSKIISKAIKLSDLDPTFKPKFKFKYFQTLKGQFILPEEVKADQLFVIAEASGNRWSRSQRVEKVYNWKGFIEMGESELKELETQVADE